VRSVVVSNRRPFLTIAGGREVTDTDPEIEALLANHLEAELGDPETARAFAAVLVEDALSWRAPMVALGEVQTIIGFTFGNRMLPNGNREPGPVNTALAEMAIGLHEATGAPVWAQWEVAEAIGERLSGDVVEAIYPGRDSHAEPRYLNTEGVVEAILARSGGGGALGKVAVVAVRDHAWRCVRICRRHGLSAGVPEGWSLPDDYDSASGQAWTRARLAYLMHDLHCRALDRRDLVIARPPGSS
jgi:hypothetical protein